MDQEQVNLTDDELRGVLPELTADPSLLDKLDSDSRRRLVKIQAEPGGARSRDWMALATGTVPMAAGAVGGIVGGVGGATLAGAAGEGYRQLIKHAKELPGAASDVIGNLMNPETRRATLAGAARGAAEGAMTATRTGFEQGALEGAGTLASAGLRAGGRAVYRGYLKPSLAKSRIRDAQNVVSTLIDERIPITTGGREKWAALKEALENKIQGIVGQTPGSVDLRPIANDVRAWAKTEFEHAGVPSADYNAALEVADTLDKSAALVNAQGRLVTNVPLAEANIIKRKLYQEVGPNQYGVVSNATNTARKVAAKGVRVAEEKIAPTLGPLNAREGRLIKAGQALNQAIEREANQNPVYGMKSLVAYGVGAGAGAGTYAGTRNKTDAAAAAVAPIAIRIGLSTGVASRAALLASRLGNAFPGVLPATAARVAIQIVMASQQDNNGND